MRISFGQSFDQGLDEINRAGAELARAQRLVSTGKRIHSVSDDPSGTVTAIGERAQLSGIETYERASSAAKSRLAVADSVLSDMVNQLTAAKVTAAGARNSGRTIEQLGVYAEEVRGVARALAADANTRVGGSYLFSGSASVPPYVVSGSSVSSYAGNGTPVSLDVAEGRAVQVSFDASAMFDVNGTDDIFAALEDLAVAIEAADTAGIAAGMDAIDAVFSQVVSTQTQVGVSQRTIEEVGAMLTSGRLGSRERISGIEDANMAAAISDLRQAEIAHEATLGSFATLARLSLMDFLK